MLSWFRKSPGLAFSGGGIRSATFNLGVVQGLAEKRLLPYIDYLSTVSGGGYIGAWLHGVIRQRGGNPFNARDTLLAGTDSAPGPPDTDPITFLRKYSNYLAPRPGLFSADTWVAPFVDRSTIGFNLVSAIAALAGLALAVIVMGRNLSPIARQSVNMETSQAAARSSSSERELPLFS